MTSVLSPVRDVSAVAAGAGAAAGRGTAGTLGDEDRIGLTATALGLAVGLGSFT